MLTLKSWSNPTESYWVLLSPTESYCTTHHTHGTLHASTASTLQFHIAGPSPFSVLCLVDSKSTCFTSTNTLAASFSCRKNLIVAHTNHGTLLCDEDLAPIDQNQKNGMQQAHAMLHDLDSVIISIQGLFQSSTSICPPCFYVVLCSSSYQFRCLFWSLCWMNEYIYIDIIFIYLPIYL